MQPGHRAAQRRLDPGPPPAAPGVADVEGHDRAHHRLRVPQRLCHPGPPCPAAPGAHYCAGRSRPTRSSDYPCPRGNIIVAAQPESGERHARPPPPRGPTTPAVTSCDHAPETLRRARSAALASFPARLGHRHGGRGGAALGRPGPGGRSLGAAVPGRRRRRPGAGGVPARLARLLRPGLGLRRGDAGQRRPPRLLRARAQLRPVHGRGAGHALPDGPGPGARPLLRLDRRPPGPGPGRLHPCLRGGDPDRRRAARGLRGDRPQQPAGARPGVRRPAAARVHQVPHRRALHPGEPAHRRGPGQRGAAGRGGDERDGVRPALPTDRRLPLLRRLDARLPGGAGPAQLAGPAGREHRRRVRPLAGLGVLHAQPPGGLLQRVPVGRLGATG